MAGQDPRRAHAQVVADWARGAVRRRVLADLKQLLLYAAQGFTPGPTQHVRGTLMSQQWARPAPFQRARWTVRAGGGTTTRTHRRAALLFRFRFRRPGFPFPSAFSFFSFLAFFSFLCFFDFLCALFFWLTALTSGPAPAPVAPTSFWSSSLTVDDMCT